MVVRYPIAPDRSFLSGIFDSTFRFSAESRQEFKSPHLLALECVQAVFPGPITKKDNLYEMNLRNVVDRCAIYSQVMSQIHGDTVRLYLDKHLDEIPNWLSVVVGDEPLNQHAYYTGFACGIGSSDPLVVREACSSRGLETKDALPTTIDWGRFVRVCITGADVYNKDAELRLIYINKTMTRIYRNTGRRKRVFTATHKHMLKHRGKVEGEPIAVKNRGLEPLTQLPAPLIRKWLDREGIEYTKGHFGLTSREETRIISLQSGGRKPLEIFRILCREFPTINQRLTSVDILRSKLNYIKRKQRNAL